MSIETETRGSSCQVSDRGDGIGPPKLISLSVDAIIGNLAYEQALFGGREFSDSARGTARFGERSENLLAGYGKQAFLNGRCHIFSSLKVRFVLRLGLWIVIGSSIIDVTVNKVTLYN